MDTTKISDQLSKPILLLYKAGGLGLVFIFIGILTMLFAFLSPSSELAKPMFIIGCFLLVSSFALFVLIQYQGPIKTNRLLKENKNVLDEVQQLSLNLTKFTYYTQSYCFKNVDKIIVVVDTVLPLVRPFIGEEGRGLATKVEGISAGIVEFSSASEKIISDIKKALELGDFKILKNYSEQLGILNSKFQSALKENNSL